MRFRLAGRNDKWRSLVCVIPIPDQVGGDAKDAIYQTTGIAHIVIPDTSGIALSTSFFLRVTGVFSLMSNH